MAVWILRQSRLKGFSGNVVYLADSSVYAILAR